MTDSQPVSDEQIEATLALMQSYDCFFVFSDDLLRSLVTKWTEPFAQAVRERDSTIANLRNDSLSYKLQLDQANASISGLERALSTTETKVSERDSRVADLRSEIADWIQRYAKANATIDEREKTIETQRRELAELREFHNKAVATVDGDAIDVLWAMNADLKREIAELRGNLEANQMTMRGMEQSKINLLEQIAELRKPVAVEPESAALSCLRRRHAAARPNPAENPSWAIAEGDIGIVLSAYDALAQDCARYANAHEVLMAEKRVLREQLDSLTRTSQQEQAYDSMCYELGQAKHCLLQAQNAAIEISGQLTAAQERERQLREAISEALELRDSAWLAVDSRKRALNNLASVLAASPAPVERRGSHQHGCALFTDAVMPCDCGFDPVGTQFACCGGSDESPPEHTQDCPGRKENGNV